MDLDLQLMLRLATLGFTFNNTEVTYCAGHGFRFTPLNSKARSIVTPRARGGFWISLNVILFVSNCGNL